MMKYRLNKKTGKDFSLLGFGAMRMPTLGGGVIDEAQAISMIRYAIDNGVNYVDTAYVYQDGESEKVVGKALKDGYREKVTLATKIPAWPLKTLEDRDKILNESLARLDVNYIDNYLVHDINEGSDPIFKKFEILDFMTAKKAEGKIKNIGFSYHGETYEFFKETVDSFDWDFVQIQLNYMDKEYQAGEAGLKYLASKGIPAVVMEPLRGGKLTDIIPDSIQALWDQTDTGYTPAEWALRWVANYPEVTTILSGMSSTAQVEENVRVLSEADANQLTENELGIIDKVADEYRARVPYGCTACEYCLPCPQKLEIPRIITFRNEATIYENPLPSKFAIRNFIEVRPSACIDCKQCEEKCPQHLPIAQIMTESAEMFE
jgi:predicted aldo/keto reductase-like oxidoreductase